MSKAFEAEWSWRAEALDILRPEFVGNVFATNPNSCDSLVVLVSIASEATLREYGPIPEECVAIAKVPTGRSDDDQAQDALQRFRAITGIFEVPAMIVIARGLIRCVGIGQVPGGQFGRECRTHLGNPDTGHLLVRRYAGARSVLQLNPIQ
jgi:hypothetical protein